jgi:hypothetical protein
MTTKLRLAVHKDLLKSATTVFNVPPPTSSIQSIKDADHVQLITYTTMPPSNVTAESHAPFQDNLVPITSVNVLLIKREPKEYGMNQENHAIAHQIFHYGTANTVSLVQLKPNLIQMKSNATTVQTDLSEIVVATLAFLDFDFSRIYFFIL